MGHPCCLWTRSLLKGTRTQLYSHQPHSGCSEGETSGHNPVARYVIPSFSQKEEQNPTSSPTLQKKMRAFPGINRFPQEAAGVSSGFSDMRGAAGHLWGLRRCPRKGIAPPARGSRASPARQEGLPQESTTSADAPDCSRAVGDAGRSHRPGQRIQPGDLGDLSDFSVSAGSQQLANQLGW